MSHFPLVNFHYSVVWDGSRIGFSEVSGLAVEHEIIEYRDGASPEYSTIKVPGLRKFSNIILKRGVFKENNDLFHWFNTGGIIVERRNIVISLLNEEHIPVISWYIKNAWPVVLKYSELNALKSEILIESLEIAHEGFKVEHS